MALSLQAKAKSYVLVLTHSVFVLFSFFVTWLLSEFSPNFHQFSPNRHMVPPWKVTPQKKWWLKTSIWG